MNGDGGNEGRGPGRGRRLGGFAPQDVQVVGDEAEGALVQLGAPHIEPALDALQMHRGRGKLQEALEKTGVLAGENHPVR